MLAPVNPRVIRTLNRLHRICRAGEKGFEAVAANVGNRGLKVLLKTYAHQRAHFAEDLAEEIRRHGGAVSERDSIRGIIHRGRIHLQAAFTIGALNVENGVLGEARLGEQAAVTTYRNALAQELPRATRALIEQQYKQTQDTREQVDLLRGRSGKRLVVQLFDSDRDVESALRALERDGLVPQSVEALDVHQVTNVYAGKAKTVREVMISGAVGGAIWGSIIGALAGLSALLAPAMQPTLGGSPQSTWAVIALIGTFAGALIAALLGFLVGLGISEEDTFVYEDSLKNGVKLLRISVDDHRAPQTAQIMRQVTAAARARAMVERSLRA